MGQPHLIILKTRSVKWYTLTLFGMIFWNCREKFENNVSYFKACILIAFETIWNCREHFENNVSIACILTAFERFGIA